MKSSFRYSVLLSSLLWATGEVECRAQDGLSWKDRFRLEAPGQWEQYRLVGGKRLQGSRQTTSIDLTAGGREFIRDRYEFKHNDTCASFLFQPLLGKDKTGKLYVMNSQYGFQLRRISPDGPWALAGIDLNLDDGFDLDPYPPDFSGMAVMVDRPLTFSGIHERLPDLVKDPDFKVNNVGSLSRGGAEWVRVDFTSRPKLLQPHEINNKQIRAGWNPLRGGWVLLDPQRYWIIREYDVQVEWQDGSTSTWATSYAYKDGRDGFPILSRVVLREKGRDVKGSPVENEHSYEYDLVEQEDLPEKEFTLSAFGLPEPVGVTWSKPTPWYLWLGLAGGVCLVLGVGFRWLKKRAARAAPAL